MKSILHLEIELNKDLEPQKEEIFALWRETEASCLWEDQDPESYASELSGSGQKMTWKLSSTALPVHQKVLEFKNRLMPLLGRDYRLGIRTLRVAHYLYEFSLEEPFEGELSVPFVKSLTFQGSSGTVEFAGLTEEFLRHDYINRIVKRVREKIKEKQYAGKGEYWELLWKSEEKKMLFREDPTNEFIARHWIKQGPTRGKWFLGPQVTRLMRTMEHIALKEVLEPLGFQEVMQPTHEAFDSLLKTGHLSGMPGEFYYISEPSTRNPEEWERFIDLVKITKKVPEDELAKRLAPPRAIACYVQCPNIYWSFSGMTIANESFPILVFDRAAVSNRYESRGRHGLERVDEFHRIEPVYIGFPEQLLALRDRFIERYKYVFNEILDIEWRMAWVTPFYLQQAGIAGVEETDRKEKGTIDFEAYMPYKGPREQAEWLEFQNLSILGDKYTGAFNIKAQDGILWSGCSGIGLERWTMAFLAQKGFDIRHWPEKFQDYFGSFPDEIKLHQMVKQAKRLGRDNDEKQSGGNK